MDVKAACTKHYEAFKGDCSGFAKAVAKDVGVTLTGDANGIADTLRAGTGGWQMLADGNAAVAAAANRLVIAGLRGDKQAHASVHGHVVVVVPGPLAHGKYPTAWWGSLGGTPAQDKTINWAWTGQDRDHVVYAAHTIG